MRARLGARRGGELRPHHLRHPPETRQWVAADRDRLHTIEEGLPHGEPAALGSRCRQPSGVRGRGPAASITRLGRHRSSAAQVSYVALGNNWRTAAVSSSRFPSLGNKCRRYQTSWIWWSALVGHLLGRQFPTATRLWIDAPAGEEMAERCRAYLGSPFSMTPDLTMIGSRPRSMFAWCSIRPVLVGKTKSLGGHFSFHSLRAGTIASRSSGIVRTLESGLWRTDIVVAIGTLPLIEFSIGRREAAYLFRQQLAQVSRRAQVPV